MVSGDVMARPAAVASASSYVTTSSTAALQNAQETVHSALESEDIGPLIRLIYSSGGGGEARVSARAEAHTLVGYSTPSVSASEGKASWQPALQILAALEACVLEQSDLISSTCRGNSEVIGASILELASMQGRARGLKERLLPANRLIQAAGASYSSCLAQLQELQHMQAAIAAASQAVQEGQKVLLLCRAAGDALQEGRHFRGHEALQRLHAEHTEEWAAAVEQIRAGGRHVAAREEGAISGLGTLQPYLTATAHQLSAALQHRAISDLNDWLVAVRAEARAIGMRALRRAAAEQARDCLLTVERQVVLAALAEAPHSLATAAACVASRSSAGAVPSATRVAARDINIEVMEGIDMAPLFRCIELHVRLGRMDHFLEYYRSNRRLQLNSDLLPPSSFLDTYQSFIAQLVGFFLVEDRVQRGAEGLTLGMQLDAGWESAAAALKVLLEAAFQSTAAAQQLLQLKEAVLLACSALGPCGYHVAPLQEALLAGRGRYQELLLAMLGPAVSGALQEDPLTPMRLTSPAAAAELLCTLGLPLSWAAGQMGPRQLPLTAPFSPCLPHLLRLVRGYVEDSAAFSTGLHSAAEALPAARQQRDTTLKRVLLEALQAQLDIASSTAADLLPRIIQITANSACLAAAVPALDQLTVALARGLPVAPLSDAEVAAPTWWAPLRSEAASSAALSSSAGPAGASVLLVALQALQEAGERVIMSVMASKVGVAMVGAKSQAWEPSTAPRSTAGVSPWMEQLLGTLQEVYTLLLKALPTDAAEHILRAVISHVNNSIVMLFVSDEGVSSYNMFALYRLHADLRGLAHCVEGFKELPGLGEELDEATQFCDLMVVGHPEDALDQGKRTKSFYALDMARLVVALRRYRELDHSYFGHSPQLPKELVKKKMVESVIAKLKLELAAVTHAKKTLTVK